MLVIFLTFITIPLLQITDTSAISSERLLLAYNQSSDSSSLDKEPSEIPDIRDKKPPTTNVPSPYSPEAESFKAEPTPAPKKRKVQESTPVVRDTYIPAAKESGEKSDLPPGWEEEEELPPGAVRIEDLSSGKKKKPVETVEETESYVPPKEEVREIAPPPDVGPVDIRNLPSSTGKAASEAAPVSEEQAPPKKVKAPVKSEPATHKVKSDLPEGWEEVEVPAGKMRLEDLPPSDSKKSDDQSLLEENDPELLAKRQKWYD